MCLIWGREPGCAPGGAVTFSCLAKRKSPKRRRPCCARPSAALRATCDARSGGAPQNSLRAARSVQTTAASQCTKCVCPSAHARTPCPALLGTHRREPSEHPFGPSRCSAQSAQRVALAPGRCGPSAATARVDVRLRVPFRMRRGAQGLADQGSRLSERSETERVRARPRQTRAPQVAP